ncbi:uncharacterized protein LOC134775272 [Penaeus indicus]|uniref:uncharacterized protein LOC134775272 n=1 Tax=Penaeus indicus TaxID=29960 RepID=UPI00300C5235
MSDLRLLLLVGLLSLSPGQGEGFYRFFPINCPGYCLRGFYHPFESTNRTLFTLHPPGDTLHARPKANGTSKVLLTFGGKSVSGNLRTQLRMDLWKDGVSFFDLGKRKYNNQIKYFEIQPNRTLELSFECPNDSQKMFLAPSGPPEDVASTSPSASQQSMVIK